MDVAYNQSNFDGRSLVIVSPDANIGFIYGHNALVVAMPVSKPYSIIRTCFVRHKFQDQMISKHTSQLTNKNVPMAAKNAIPSAYQIAILNDPFLSEESDDR
jgi:hypothetical protein